MENRLRENRRSGLTGNQLKLIGAALMLLDHIHQMFAAQGAPVWFTWLGRLVAPIFIFMSSEGFHYTRSRARYMLLLFGGFEFMALFSTLISGWMPSDIMLMNNIFGTMFVAAVYMLAYDMIRGGIREKRPGKIALGALAAALPVAAGLALMGLFSFHPEILLAMPRWLLTIILSHIPTALTVEGGPTLVLLGLLFYVLREHRTPQFCALGTFAALELASSIQQVWPAVAAGESSWVKLFTYDPQWMMVFATIPLLFYNGKRGGGSKYFFYVFYPAHIYALYALAWLCAR
jgi:hypothetical protein